MTQHEAIKELRSHDRHIMSAEWGEQICKAFKTSLKELGLAGVKAKDYHNAFVHPDQDDEPSVSADRLAVKLAKHLGHEKGSDGDPLGTSPYIGHGTSASHVVEQATAAIEKTAST